MKTVKKRAKKQSEKITKLSESSEKNFKKKTDNLKKNP